jgi:hypothetical protein
MRRAIPVAIALVAVLCFGSPAGATWSASDQQYILVFSSGITWESAASEVAALGGSYHLATITSDEEEAYVRGMLRGVTGSLWLGAYEDSTGWHWVTGEAWSNTYWSLWEPAVALASTALSTDYLTLWNAYGRHVWLSATDADAEGVTGYLMERDLTAVPIPSSVWFLASGLPLLPGLRRLGPGRAGA